MQINTYLADNLTALATSKAPVAAWLAANAPEPETLVAHIFKNRHGVIDWRMEDGNGLFEAIPPHLLYRGWRPKDKAEGGATVIVGTALGYGLNHVLTGTPPSHKVVVIDPRPEMLLACLGQTDYRPFLAAGKLSFLPPDPAVVGKALMSLDVSFLFARINLRSDLASTQMGPEYAQTLAMVQAKLESLSVELNTLRFKQETMVGNELRNFSRAMHDGSLNRMAGLAKGLTVVVLGAGPSLPRFVPALQRHRDKALFVTALQTLPVLEQLGLKPDLCLGLDYSDHMMLCMENLRDIDFAADIPLIYSTKMQPAVLDRYPGPKLPLWTQGGIATYVLKDQEMVLDAGGNVGVTLERFLTWAGADRFILVGQDLAWSGKSTHAPGHHGANWEFSYVAERYIRLSDRDGQDIYTDHAFMAAKRDFENDIAATKLTVFNLYGGGVVIGGTTAIDSDDLERADILPNSNAVRELFLAHLDRAARPRAKPVFSPKAESWATSLKNASRRLEKLVRRADKHQGEIKELLSQIQFFMRHDPLYMPYLYNEIMDMAGLIHTNPKYGARELTAFKAIRRRVVNKVKEIDANLGPSSSWAA